MIHRFAAKRSKLISVESEFMSLKEKYQARKLQIIELSEARQTEKLQFQADIRTKEMFYQSDVEKRL